VTLTESGARHLSEHFPDATGRPIAVIPTCADLDRFHPAPSNDEGDLVLGYVGSANEAYLFPEFLLTYLALARRLPRARLLILNRRDHAYIRQELARLQIPDERVEMRAVDHDDVPAEMRRMTVGTVFVYPYAAKIGSTPTKLAEFLGSGIPCLANEGCGDVSAILEQHAVGTSIRSFTPGEIETMVDRLLTLLADPELGSRCRRVALDQFSLVSACDRYHELYLALRNCAPALVSSTAGQ
jgi:glycosyltransferase involved in cell wall biosynthesis